MTAPRLAMAALAGAVFLTACGGSEPGETPSSTEPAAQRAERAAAETVTGTPAGEEAVTVRFAQPADGAELQSPFRVEMVAEGVRVAPAGTMEEGTGHMHILIDAPFVAPGEVIPTDERHRHYGDGSTTAELDLAPGDYVLRLQFADGAHRGLEGDEYRDEIRVTVTE